MYVILCHLAFKKDGRISYGVAEPIVTTPLIALDNLDYCRLSSHMTIFACSLASHTLNGPSYRYTLNSFFKTISFTVPERICLSRFWIRAGSRVRGLGLYSRATKVTIINAHFVLLYII